MENGFNGLRDVKFRLDEDTYNKIKETEVFKMWVHEQDSIKRSGESAKYYEKKAGWDDVVWFLDSKVRSVMEISVKYDMKERYSYDFVEDSYNFIYVKDGEVKVSVFYKSQTGAGVYKIGCTYITIKLENGKAKASYL